MHLCLRHCAVGFHWLPTLFECFQQCESAFLYCLSISIQSLWDSRTESSVNLDRAVGVCRRCYLSLHQFGSYSCALETDLSLSPYSPLWLANAPTQKTTKSLQHVCVPLLPFQRLNQLGIHPHLHLLSPLVGCLMLSLLVVWLLSAKSTRTQRV